MRAGSDESMMGRGSGPRFPVWVQANTWASATGLSVTVTQKAAVGLLPSMLHLS